MGFAERYGPNEPPPMRGVRDDAPSEVRRLLLDLLEENDELDPYEALSAALGRVPDGSMTGFERRDQVRNDIRRLDWWLVYDLIEQHSNSWHDSERINDVLAQNGIAFDYVDGEFVPYEPDAQEMEIATVEEEVLATQDPNGRFKDAKAQYGKAVAFLASRPPDLENAVANAVNSNEGAVTVVTGRKTLSDGLKTLFGAERTALRLSIEQLHNYGSAVPGVRHGAHAASDLNEHEARYVVRSAGSALAYLIAASYEGLIS